MFFLLCGVIFRFFFVDCFFFVLYFLAPSPFKRARMHMWLPLRFHVVFVSRRPHGLGGGGWWGGWVKCVQCDEPPGMEVQLP